MCQEKTAKENVQAHSLNIVMAKHQLEDEVEDSNLLTIYCLNHSPAPPITVNNEVNGFVIPMEVDTGTTTSLLNWDTFQKINISSQFDLSPTKCKFQTYSGKIILLKRVVKAEFSLEGKNVLITSENYPNVLGRDILGVLCLNWNELFVVLMISDCTTDVPLKNILPEYQDIFTDKLGTLKNVQVTNPFDHSAKPKLYRA